MKKIEFRTKDGDQYTLTNIRPKERANAVLLFKKWEGDCVDHDLYNIGYKFDTLPCSKCLLCEDCPGHGYESRIIGSSIKITY